MITNKPLILVTNDDGITSQGIKVLIKVMKKIGEVVVISPDKPQSGMGHAITITTPLKLKPSKLFPDVEAYECSGTPADCVKLAKHSILKNKKIDLVVSGINHGSNTSISILYSGTMSAAIEGALEGLPSIGFSLCDYSHEADFSHIESYVQMISLEVLKKGIQKGVALNVNFPKSQKNPIKGIKICRQAKAFWKEEFEERFDPHGQKYYWMHGEFVNLDEKNSNDDESAILSNYVSITPCKYDLTDYDELNRITDEWSFT